MSIFGVRIRDAAGNVTFDSTVDQVLSFIEEHYIPGSGFANLYYTYPAFAGKKIAAFMVSPYQNGDIDGYQVQSCRVSYPSGVPRVDVFTDRPQTAVPVCDGYLTVFSTGAPQ